MNIRRTADRLKALADELGATTSVHRAQTGTAYVTVISNRSLCDIVIRVADHADAHATASYTCDGVEGTPRGARAYLLRSLGTSDRAVRRLRRMRKRSDDVAMRCRAERTVADLLAHNEQRSLVDWASDRVATCYREDRSYWQTVLQLVRDAAAPVCTGLV